MTRPLSFLTMFAVASSFRPSDSLARPPRGGHDIKRREIVFTLRQWEGEYATDASGSPRTTVRSDVWVVRSDGSGLRRVTQLGKGTGNVQWSPDGTWLYFQSNATGDYEIYRCRPDGTEAVNLTHSPETEDYGFHLSPDGKLIVYSGYEQGQPACTRLMNADGTGQRVAVPATYNYMARFSPDGKSLGVRPGITGMGSP
ncbi:MAG: PD40 domain-containing protein [Armatimonadetes bacterium]|nr:PD40 domain-containing protein [Armatimonadota bacterium]